jgi:hypothetical protein
LSDAEFGADGFDVGVYGSVGHGAGVLPGVIEQLIAGEDAAGFFDENEQEFVFVGGEIEGCALELDAHGGGIVMEDGDWEVEWSLRGGLLVVAAT